MESNKLQIKLVVVGDEGVGKQSLLHIFATNKTIPRSHDMPLTEASYTLDIEVHGKPIILYRLHTAGYEEYDQTRHLFYHNTNVALVCFSIADRHSLENVSRKWIPEIQRYCPKAPIVLVGTKLDLRKKGFNNATRQTGAACPLDLPPDGAACNPDMLIPPSEGKRVADRFKAVAYAECSVKDDAGVQTVFETAVTASLNPPKDEYKRCLLL